MELPLRCPQCNALVVDRRSPVCTTCRAALPTEWVMTPEQSAKIKAIDRAARAEHAAMIKILDPANDPDKPMWLRMLESDPR